MKKSLKNGDMAHLHYKAGIFFFFKKLNMLGLSLLFGLFLLPLLSEEYVDINAQIPYRTQQYPMGNYEKILVCSPYRTGSTLLFNVLRFLFEDVRVLNQSTFEKNVPNAKVGKAHAIFSPKKHHFIFIPVRNPLDACYSYCRFQYKDKEVSETDLDKIVDDYIQKMTKADLLLQKHKNVIALKYEDFAEDFDYLFDLIQAVFSIQVHEKDKCLIKKALSKENVAANIQKYKSYNKFDRSTHFHGNHIDLTTTPTQRQEILKSRIHEKLEPYEDLFERWGYTLSTS